MKPITRAKASPKAVTRVGQQRGVMPLVRIIQDLRSLVIEHHSYDVMSREHGLCPKCTLKKWDKVLNKTAAAIQRHNAKLTDGGCVK